MTDNQTTTEQKLAWFFLEMWKTFCDAGCLDGAELGDIIEKSDLAFWRDCTEEEANQMDGMEEGDAALFLTAEGKRVTAMGREVEKRNVKV